MLDEKHQARVAKIAESFRGVCEERGFDFARGNLREFVNQNMLGSIVEVDDLGDEYVAGEIQKLNLDPLEESVSLDGVENFHIKLNTNARAYIGFGQDPSGNNQLVAHSLGHLFLHLGYCVDKGMWNELNLSQSYKDSHLHRFSYSQEEKEAREFADIFFSPAPR